MEKSKFNFKRLLESRWINILLPIVFLAVLVALFGILRPRFISAANINILLNQSLIVAVVATGASFIFTTGNVNIAMGSATALTATLSAMIYNATGSIFLMFASAIVLGAAIMYICAFISARLHVMVVFVTIVMMVLLTAIQQQIVSGGDIQIDPGVTKGMREANVPLIVFLAFVIICCIIFHFTKVGRALKLVGANEECAEITGHSRAFYLTLAFIIAGIGVGLGSVLTIVRTGTINMNTCATMNMDVMLAIVLGGMPVYGGSKSRAYAATIGAFTVTVLNNGLTMLGVDSTVLQGVRGIIFLALIVVSSKRSILLPKREE